jgi:hypothetical protein
MPKKVLGPARTHKRIHLNPLLIGGFPWTMQVRIRGRLNSSRIFYC